MNHTSNNQRTQLQQTIRNKQQLCKRFNRRLNAATNPSERTFLKNEINNCVKDLKQYARQWKNQEFGSATWITTGFATTNSNRRTSNNRNGGSRNNKRSRTSNRSNRSTNAFGRNSRAFSYAF